MLPVWYLCMLFLSHSRRGQFTIVPVLVGSLSLEREQAYGQVFAHHLANPENLFVISSDFCHWGTSAHVKPNSYYGIFLISWSGFVCNIVLWQRFIQIVVITSCCQVILSARPDIDQMNYHLVCRNYDQFLCWCAFEHKPYHANNSQPREIVYQITELWKHCL